MSQMFLKKLVGQVPLENRGVGEFPSLELQDVLRNRKVHIQTREVDLPWVRETPFKTLGWGVG